MNDPVDELSEISMARFAIGIAVIREAAAALGMPEDQIAGVIERARATFLSELAAAVTMARAICDEPGAVRH